MISQYDQDGTVRVVIYKGNYVLYLLTSQKRIHDVDCQGVSGSVQHDGANGFPCGAVISDRLALNA